MAGRSRPACHRLSQPWRGHTRASYGVMRLREPHMARVCQPERWRRIYQGSFFINPSVGLRLAFLGTLLLAQAHHSRLCPRKAPPPPRPTVAHGRLRGPPARPPWVAAARRTPCKSCQSVVFPAWRPETVGYPSWLRAVQPVVYRWCTCSLVMA